MYVLVFYLILAMIIVSGIKKVNLMNQGGKPYEQKNCNIKWESA